MAYFGSQTDILNYALVSVLGEPPITDITDNVKSAKTLSAIYDTVRQNELRKAIWKFAHKRVLIASITPSASVLPNGIPPPYAYAYQMPNNVLKLISFANTRQSLGMINYRTGMEKFYDWQGRYIFTNLGLGANWGTTVQNPLPPPASQWIEFIDDTKDTTLFDSNFAVAFACALAKASCKAITGKLDMYASASKDYNDAIGIAMTNNAIERLPEGYADDSYTLSRL